MQQSVADHITKMMLLGALLVLYSSIACAQEEWTITLEAGYESGMRPRQSEIMAASIPRRLSSGDDLGIAEIINSDHSGTAWLGAGLLLPKLLGEEIELEARASAGYSGIAVTGEFRTDVPGSTSRLQIAEYDLKADATKLRLDLLSRYSLSGAMHVEAGLWMDYRVGASFTRRLFFVQDSNAIIPDLRPPVVFEEGRNFVSSPVAIGAALGLGYHIRLAGRLALRPAMRLRADLGAIGEPYGRMFSLGLGMGVVF